MMDPAGLGVTHDLLYTVESTKHGIIMQDLVQRAKVAI
jgi:hypothetical protein